MEPEGDISVARQCELLGLPPSTYYYQPAGESELNLMLMRMIDERHMEKSFEGVIRMTDWLEDSLGTAVNYKRVRRLMGIMDIRTIYPRPRTTIPSEEHVKYPYLLRGLDINRPNQVWCADITYIYMHQGYMYLVAVMDWYSRYVLSWRISNTLDASFCVDALDEALGIATPEIFNTDQGVQFTCNDFISRLKANQIAISMDGKGRAIDNVFIERLWRSVKYDDIYINCYETGPALYRGLGSYFGYHNYEKHHQGHGMGKLRPAEVYYGI